jgi:hypothetical protein
MIMAGAIIVADLWKHRIRWYVVAAAAFVGATTVKWPWNSQILRQPLPTWIVQVVLVPIVIWLAVEPLMEVIRKHRDVNSTQEMADATQ